MVETTHKSVDLISPTRCARLLIDHHTCGASKRDARIKLWAWFTDLCAGVNRKAPRVWNLPAELPGQLRGLAELARRQADHPMASVIRVDFGSVRGEMHGGGENKSLADSASDWLTDRMQGVR